MVSNIALTISSLAAIISVIIAIISSVKNNKSAKKANELQEESNRIQAGQRFLGWNDIERYVRGILHKMNDDGFVPTCIFATSIGSSIVASMIAKRLVNEPDTSIPIFSGMLIGRKKEDEEIITYEGFDVSELAKRGFLLIPKDLPIRNSDQILIVRDHSGSGICFDILIKYFGNKNVKKNNIRTACIAYNAETRYIVPDYSCFETDKIWFPWGKNL